MYKSIIKSSILLSTLIFSVLSQPTPVGEWLFDDASNLLKANIGEDLSLTGTHTAISGPQDSDGAISIGSGSYYTLTHGISANGGGSNVNEYSLLFDFRVSDVSVWHSFFQTTEANSDDAECFIKNGAGTIGIINTGYSTKIVEENVWYRLVVAVDNGSEYSIYLDGIKILTGTVQDVDSRFSLSSSVLLFADESGEDGTIDIAKIAIFSKALSSSEVGQLGGYNSAVGTDFLAGPYLQAASSTSMTIMWESENSVPGSVNYGVTTNYGNSAIASVVSTGGNTYVHKVRLTSLDPGTVYNYTATCGDLTTNNETFKTAPGDKKSSFKFGIWGDSHYASPFNKMAKHMVEESKIDFASNTGDLSNTGNTYSDFQSVFVSYAIKTIGTAVPFYTSFGNHDVGGNWGGGDEIRKFVDQPNEINSDPNGFSGSYVVDYGGVVIISIDWNRMNSDITNGWLETQLQSDLVQKARFSFIFIHCAPYYERWHVAEQAVVRDNIPALAEQYGVNAVFSGHMHGYERGNKNGTFYVTGGGSSYLDTGEPVDTNYAHITQGSWENDPVNFNYGLVNEYVTVEVIDSVAIGRMHAFNSSGSYIGVLDTFIMIDELWDPTSIDQSKILNINNNQADIKTFSDHIKLSFLNNVNHGEAVLYNQQGKVLVRKKLNGTKTCIINTNNISAGLYLVGLKTSSGNISVQKIVVK